VAWSAVTSEVIEASEAGTADRRNIEEWMLDVDGMNDDDVEFSPQSVTETSNGDRSITIISFLLQLALRRK
jgi:hypothetical protein